MEPEEAIVLGLALCLSDRPLEVVKAKDKDNVLTYGDGLQLRVRSNGSTQRNFSYYELVIKNLMGWVLPRALTSER